MKKNRLTLCLLGAGTVWAVSSCQDYVPESEQMMKEIAYAREFERQLGPVDPNHDWSMATRVTADIDLSDAPEGTYEVKIFSEEKGYLLTKAIIEKSAQISFDAIKGESNVRILARKTSALGLSVINGYFPIENGMVSTSKVGTRAASTGDQCNTTVGDRIDLGTKKADVSVEDYQAESNFNFDTQGNTMASLPSDDGIYYITKIDGQSYGNGDNGLYSVTRNGSTSQKDMHDIDDIINGGEDVTWRYYMETAAQYKYTPAKDGYYADFVTVLPSDGKYYITPISGQDYSDGADGLYSVTRNGSTSQMTMHEISDIIASGNFVTNKAGTKDFSWTEWDWKYEYESYGNVTKTYGYSPAEGSFGSYNSEQAAALPNSDGIYYITTIEGESYEDNANGKYSVTYNGVTTQYDMYEIGKVIAGANYKCYAGTPTSANIVNWCVPAYYKVKSAFINNVDGFVLAGGTYVYPAYYEKTKSAGYTIADDYVSPAYYKTNTKTIDGVKWAGDFYYLNDVYKSIDPGTQVLFDDLLPLVSSAHPNPIFHEQVDNRTKFEDKLDFNVELVLTESGPMTYTYVFYGSVYHNMLGYFYWNETEGMTEAEKKQARLNAPRYVLMEDTYPTTEQTETGKPNLQCYGDRDGSNAHTPGGMDMPTWVDTGIEAHTGHYLQGTTYHMVYFGEDYQGQASYTFPEGLHVAFFLLTKATEGGANQSNKGTGLFYSIQDMNNDVEIFEDAEGNKYFLNDKHWWASQDASGNYDASEERSDVGEVAAVFYSYKGNVVMGFEDDVDKDENDMLFLISAPIDPPVTLTTEDENTWIVACEDLGNIYDYDFNDLVFEVSLHTTTTTTTSQGETTVESSTEVLFRPLAAGGTLPAKVYLGQTEIGEIHGLLGGTSTSIPINVGGEGISVDLARREPTAVNTGTTTYTDISSVLRDIKIVVENGEDREATEITAPNVAEASLVPQMLLLPKGWDWPNERIHIYDVYPKFAEWVADMEKNGWIEDPKAKGIAASLYHVNPFK